MKNETKFRTTLVAPFLRSLKHTAVFAIQQLAIHGTPDYLLCTRGRFVGLELKDGEEVPHGIQLFNLDRITKAHGVAIVARPSNWESVKRQLRRLDEGEE